MGRASGKKLTVGLVGATGLVGNAILRALEKSRLPVGELRPWATGRSAGKRVGFGRRLLTVREIDPTEFPGCHLIIFAGTEGERGASVLYARKAVEAGAVVIDNGSDFRLDPRVPLVVPEVNPGDAGKHRGLLANPNCSTIQMAVALAPIHRRFGIKRVVVSTYQSVSGAGRGGVEALRVEVKGQRSKLKNTVFERRIAGNVIPQIGGPGDLGYTAEEWKMVRETRKILHEPGLPINATTVRVPVEVGHSESIYFETGRGATLRQVEACLAGAPGLVYKKTGYHTPAEIAGRDGVFVSRLRPDPSVKSAFSLWCVSDNLRKGAAANAVQIAWLLYKYRLFNNRRSR